MCLAVKKTQLFWTRLSKKENDGQEGRRDGGELWRPRYGCCFYFGGWRPFESLGRRVYPDYIVRINLHVVRKIEVGEQGGNRSLL